MRTRKPFIVKKKKKNDGVRGGGRRRGKQQQKNKRKKKPKRNKTQAAIQYLVARTPVRLLDKSGMVCIRTREKVMSRPEKLTTISHYAWDRARKSSTPAFNCYKSRAHAQRPQHSKSSMRDTHVFCRCIPPPPPSARTPPSRSFTQPSGGRAAHKNHSCLRLNRHLCNSMGKEMMGRVHRREKSEARFFCN